MTASPAYTHRPPLDPPAALFALALTACALWHTGCATDSAPSIAAEAAPDAAHDPDATPEPALEPWDSPPAIQPGAEPVAGLAPVVHCGDLRGFSASPSVAGADRWTAWGSLGGPSQTRSSCGGDGPEAVTRFVAPRDGVYTVIGSSDRGSPPLVYIRSACEDVSHAAEIICRRPLDASRPTVVTASARAGDVLWLFVDAPAPEPADERVGIELVVLHADAVVAPWFGEVEVEAVEGSDELRVSTLVQDGNGDIERIELTWLGDGGRVLGDAIGLPFARPLFDERWIQVAAQVGPPPVGARRIALMATDSTGRSGEIAAIIGRTPINGRCDPHGVESRCTAGAVCVVVADYARCVPEGGIRILSAAAALDGDGARVQLAVSAPDRPIERAIVTLTDARGRPLADPITRSVVWPDGAAAATVHLDAAPAHLADHPPVVQIQLADGGGRLSAARAVPVLGPRVIDDGGACDPLGVVTVCAGDSTCIGATGQTRCGRPRRLGVRRGLSQLRVDAAGRSATIELVVNDLQSRDLADLPVAFLARGEPIGRGTWGAPFHRAQCDARYCTWRAQGPLPLTVVDALSADPDGWLTARVDVRPSRGSAPDVVELAWRRPAALEPEAACDPGALDEICPAQMFCAELDPARSSCRPGTAPGIYAAEAILHPDRGAVSVRAWGFDAGRDVDGLELALLDELGVLLNAEPAIPVASEMSWSGGGDVELSGFVALAPDRIGIVRRARTVRVRIADPLTLDSPWLPVRPSALDVAGPGEACDRSGAFTRCADGLLCVDWDPTDDQPEPVCEAPRPVCPEDWIGADLEPLPDGGWGAAGDTDHLEPEQPGAVHVFYAPEDGRYAFEVDSAQALDVHVRAVCLVPASARADRSPRGEVAVVRLRAGEPAQIIVTAADAGAPGPYALTARRHVPLRIDEAAVRAVPRANRVAIDLSWPLDAPDPAEVVVHRHDDEGAVGGPIARGPVVVIGAGDGQRTGRAEVYARWDGLDRDRISVTAVDALGVSAPAIRTVFPQADLAGDGELCDPLRTRSICGGGLDCPDPGTRLDLTCRLMPDVCPPDWPVADLHDARDWALVSEPGGLERVDGVVSACADSGGAADVYRFWAPNAGRYRFTVEGPGGRLLSIRRRCAVPEPWICGEQQGTLSDATAVFARAESVYIVVGVGADPLGYTIDVTRL